LLPPRFGAVLLVTVLGSPLLHAEDRVRLILNSALGPTTRSFSQKLTYTEFVETATVKAQYETKSAFSPDVGAQVQVFRKLGVVVAFTLARRDEKGSFSASLPHPLYLDRARSLQGDLSGYRYQERAVHFDLAFGTASGPIDYALFAGVSAFWVEADLVDRVRYDQTYPYDSVTLREVPPRAVKNNPTGFNVGGRLDYRFGRSRRFGLGVQLRFSVATARLETPDSSTVKVDAGGLLAGIGTRLYF
jgi:hypothetical protein